MSTLTAIEEFYDALDERTLKILERRRSTNHLIRRRGWFVRRALLAADLVGLTVAFAAAQQIYSRHVGGANALSDLTELLLFAASLPGWVIAAKLYGLYDRDDERADHSTPDDLFRVLHLVTVCSWGLLGLFSVTHLAHPQVGKLLAFWALAIFLVTGGRAAARTACRRHISYLQNTIVVGAGDTGQSIARKLLSHPEYGLNLVGFVDSNPKERHEGLEHLTLLGDLSDLGRVVDLLDVERVIVAFTGDGHEELVEAIAALRDQDVQIDIVPRLFDNLGPGISIHTIEGIPLVGLPTIRLPRSSLFVKRALDLVISFVLLAISLPVLVVVAVVVVFDSGRPIFYRHVRVGRGGADVHLLKFRTMFAEHCRGEQYGGADAERAFAELLDDPRRRVEFETTFKLRDDPRVTRVGSFLRRTSLDELPQLWNIVRGDISLVGPRALTSEEISKYYGSAASDLLGIRPGLTGYWQVNGRSDLQYADRVRLDMAYIGGWSLGLDLLILARTLRVVFSSRNAY